MYYNEIICLNAKIFYAMPKHSFIQNSVPNKSL